MPFRFSLKWLLVTVVVVAIFTAALLRPSDLLLKVVATGTLLSLAVAVAGTVAFGGTARSFCAGYSIMGLVRFFFEMYPVPTRAGFDRDDLLPNALFYMILSRFSGTDQYQTANRTICYAIVVTSALVSGLVTVYLYRLANPNQAPISSKMDENGG